MRNSRQDGLSDISPYKSILILHLDFKIELQQKSKFMLSNQDYETNFLFIPNRFNGISLGSHNRFITYRNNRYKYYQKSRDKKYIRANSYAVGKIAQPVLHFFIKCYSALRVLTGSVLAAPKVWTEIVTKAIVRMTIPAARKIQASREVR